MGEFHYVGDEALKARFMLALEDEIMEAADDVRVLARAATPVDTSALRNTMRTDGPRVGANRVSSRVVAGEGLPYGVIVHERHHDGGGGTHFIARPLLGYAPRLVERVRNAGRKAY